MVKAAGGRQPSVGVGVVVDAPILDNYRGSPETVEYLTIVKEE